VKLAIIRQKYNPFGGAERFVERALNALNRPDLDITVLARAWPPQAGGANYRRQLLNPFYLGSTWRDWGFAHAATAAVAAGGFDLVQSHERIPCCDIYRAGDGLHRVWLKQRRAARRAQGLSAWPSLNIYHRYILAAETALFRSPRLKAVICISRMVRREVLEYFGEHFKTSSHADSPDDCLPVIYNCVDTGFFHPGLKAARQEARRRYAIPPEVPLFLFVGSGFERKGLAAAIRQLPAEAWLLVVGKDKRLPHYRQLAECCGAAGRVCFAGPQQDLRPYYGAADALVFPTIYEPFGNVVLEALACGLPVVTTTACGGAEAIEAGVSGLVVDAFDEAALGQAMFEMTDLSRVAAMGRQAVQAAAAFSGELMAGRMIALYRRLL